MPGRPAYLNCFGEAQNKQATDFIILDGLYTGILHRMGLPTGSDTTLKFILLLGGFPDAYPKGLRISRDSPIDTK
jgi:hypothetical protein